MSSRGLPLTLTDPPMMLRSSPPATPETSPGDDALTSTGDAPLDDLYADLAL